jgi:DNA primase catalytic core
VARIKDSSVERVRDGADFVAVVEERTPLRKQGAHLEGRCPFHEERTPSFSVNPVKKLFYCFGCHKGGDMIEFVRETQGVDFVGAVEWLAERFRIPLEYEESSPLEDARRLRIKRLHALLEDATTFYERYLWESQAGSAARGYLAGRGLGEDVCREFRLGLALGGGTLTRKALEKGFSVEELRDAGLARARGGDYFERRLVFPLADARGRVLGFQARRLHDDDPLQAKYVNTPESVLFSKRSVLYGLDKARALIAREDRACVVEGNTDVIALRQAGFLPVVACMGTALTEEQLDELARLTRRLWLAFDGDAAGEAASLRGMERAVKHGFDVKVVALAPGVDPADDPLGFEATLGDALPYVVHRIQVTARSEPDREAARRAVGAFLNGVPDSLDRRAAWRWANDYFGMSLQIRGGGTASTATAPSPRLSGAVDRLERGALAGVIAHPGLMPTLAAITPEHFRDETNRRLRAHLVEGTDATGAELALLAELDALVPQEGIDEATAMEYLLRLRERELWDELQHADIDRTRELRDALGHIQDALGRLAGEQPTSPV